MLSIMIWYEIYDTEVHYVVVKDLIGSQLSLHTQICTENEHRKNCK